jgi:elongation factor 2
MRAVDGCIILVCNVEGVMPQSETVARQALRERVKPVLFINKVDRVIKELKLNPEEMQARFKKIIDDVNALIEKYAEEPFKKEWRVSVTDGSVAFGSALKHWAISIPYMQRTGITFKDIIRLTLEGKEDELAKLAPLHQVVLEMIIKHLPNPLEAIKYRLEKIWTGDMSSDIARQMLACDPNGSVVGIVTKMVPDPHVGFVATVRLFSGKVHKGKEVWLIGQAKKERIQQVAVYKGLTRIPVDEVTAGNIAAIVGIPGSFTGETLCEPDMPIEPFVEIRHIFEPVVTKSVEPKNPRDLPKLVNALKKIAREDATLVVKINPETGEYLVSGLGELHLEAKVERKLLESELDIVMSPPIVVYREAIFDSSPVVEGKSPNKHNKLYISVEPLEASVYDAMLRELLPSKLELKKKRPQLIQRFIQAGLPREEAKNVILIHNRNLLIDLSRGVQYLTEVIEMIKDAFEQMMDEGPLAREPCMRLKVKLMDAKLHEDPVHRGPAQIMPATRYAIREAMLRARPTLLEPKQIIRIDVPAELMGRAIKEVEGRRGQVLDIKEEKGVSIVTAKVPVAEMFGFDAALKSATGGRGFYSLIEVVFEKLPSELREGVILGIRKRKGLVEKIPEPSGI